MKSFTCKALAVAAAAACGTTAFAGSLAVTKRDFALEAITNTTPVVIPNALLTIGVARTAAQDFTVVVKPNTASSRFNGSCPLPTNTVAGSGAVTVSLKRAGGTECAYEVDVTADSNASAIQLTFANLVFANHSLATEGATESIRFNVVELSESARIDNSEDLVNVVAQSHRAVTLVANQDTGTSADVLFNNGNSPLFGFISQNGDSTTLAEANFVVSVNGSLTNAAGTAFNAAVDVAKITFTVTGDQDGLDVANAAATVGTGGGSATVIPGTSIAAAGNGAAATLTFNAVGSAFNATGNTTVQLRLPTAATKSLGTSRTFGVSAVVDPQLPGVADQALAGNSSWWVWTANAIELRSAFFNNYADTMNATRFFFQNVGASATYTATCQAEAGRTVTYGAARSGNLVNGTTAINASDICTFSVGNRGSITFTINSSAGKIKGVYQQALNGTAAGYIPLERPYNNANPTY